MKQPILIGVDGGGTKTRVLVRRIHEKTLLWEHDYPESNYQNIGFGAVSALFRRILCDLTPLLSGGSQEAVWVMGMAGIDRDSDADAYLEHLRQAGFQGRAYAYNDAYIALMGAHGGASGAIVICGTGSIAAGLSASGQILRSGGWGALASDEGSGFRLGVEGIAAVFRAYDGSGPQTALTPILLSQYGRDTVPGLVDVVSGGDGLPVRAIAEAAPAVVRLAEDDPVCREILDRQAAALAGMVGGLAARMERPDFPLACMGGLLTHVPEYRARFVRELHRKYPQIQIAAPQGDAAQGALVQAERLACSEIC